MQKPTILKVWIVYQLLWLVIDINDIFVILYKLGKFMYTILLLLIIPVSIKIKFVILK